MTVAPLCLVFVPHLLSRLFLLLIHLSCLRFLVCSSIASFLAILRFIPPAAGGRYRIFLGRCLCGRGCCAIQSQSCAPLYTTCTSSLVSPGFSRSEVKRISQSVEMRVVFCWMGLSVISLWLFRWWTVTAAFCSNLSGKGRSSMALSNQQRRWQPLRGGYSECTKKSRAVYF